MQNLDPRASIEAKILINQNITSNTTAVGTVIDVEPCISKVVTFEYAIDNRTDGTYTPLLEWSDDNVTFVAVPDAQISYIDPTTGESIESGQEALAALSANGKSVISVRDNKRYIRPSFVPASVTTGANATCLVKFGKRVSY